MVKCIGEESYEQAHIRLGLLVECLGMGNIWHAPGDYMRPRARLCGARQIRQARRRVHRVGATLNQQQRARRNRGNRLHRTHRGDIHVIEDAGGAQDAGSEEARQLLRRGSSRSMVGAISA